MQSASVKIRIAVTDGVRRSILNAYRKSIQKLMGTPPEESDTGYYWKRRKGLQTMYSTAEPLLVGPALSPVLFACALVLPHLQVAENRSTRGLGFEHHTDLLS